MDIKISKDDYVKGGTKAVGAAVSSALIAAGAAAGPAGFAAACIVYALQMFYEIENYFLNPHPTTAFNLVLLEHDELIPSFDTTNRFKWYTHPLPIDYDISGFHNPIKYSPPQEEITQLPKFEDWDKITGCYDKVTGIVYALPSYVYCLRFSPRFQNPPLYYASQLSYRGLEFFSNKAKEFATHKKLIDFRQDFLTCYSFCQMELTLRKEKSKALEENPETSNLANLALENPAVNNSISSQIDTRSSTETLEARKYIIRPSAQEVKDSWSKSLPFWFLGGGILLLFL